MGPWLLRVAGALLGWLAGSVLRIRRAHVEASMRAAGLPDAGAEARAMYASLGASALELLWMAWSGERALARVRIEEGSRRLWEGALARGRGVVIAASHTGNWDLAACAVAREAELLVVTKHLRVGWLDRFWQRTRAARGVLLASASGALARARPVLRRGGAVAMMIDQAPDSTRHALATPFLGRTAWVDRAPAALAASTGAALVVAASRRDAHGGGHVLQVLDVLVPPLRPSRAWMDGATIAATRALDAFVRAHPSQWLWLHRRWKAVPGAATLAPPCKTPSSSPGEASRAA